MTRTETASVQRSAGSERSAPRPVAGSVTWITRRPAPGNYSIERVIETLRAEVEARGWRVDLRVAPFVSRGAWRRIGNVLWAMSLPRSDLSVVWGDINYVVPFHRSRRKILVVHDLLSLGRLSGLRRALIRWLWWRWPIRACDEIVAVSRMSAAELRSEFGDRRPVQVIENPLTIRIPARRNSGRKRNGQEALRVLQIGTKWNKNVMRVARATQRIGGELLVVGPLAPEEHEKLASLGVRFTIAQRMTDEQLAEAIAQADVLAFVSLAEGFGLPILEAQAVGTPVVTADREPMLTVAGGGAVLVDPLDEEQIAEGLLAAALQRGPGEGSVERGRKNVEKYRPERAANGWVAVFERALDRIHPASSDGRA